MKAIITADWHLRYDVPRCRTETQEEWFATQSRIVEEICEKANTFKCPLVIIGDIFNTPCQPEWIVNMLIGKLRTVGKGVYIIAGNHDLPFHNFENVESSSYGVLNSLEGTFIHPLSEIGMANHFGLPQNGTNNEIVFIHELIFPNSKSMPPMIKARTAQDLLDAFPEANWIFTGDYHHTFIVKKKNRTVLNAGCITRQVADMAEYSPVIYFVDTETNYTEAFPLSDTAQVVTDSYLRKEEEREDRIESFVTSIKDAKEISLDFVANVHKVLENNKKIADETKNEVLSLMED